jgi:hypothetical protein
MSITDGIVPEELKVSVADAEARCRVSFDGRVMPPDAARFLGISERTLRQWRDERRGPPAVYRRLWGHAWSYEIRSLYEFKLFSALGQNDSGSHH